MFTSAINNRCYNNNLLADDEIQLMPMGRFDFYDPTELVKSFHLTPVGAARAVEGTSLLPISNFVWD